MALLNTTDSQSIKTLNQKQKEQLAAEVRHFLIESIGKTGGHLASNLGIVEVTIALHAVFDFSIDHVVFDGGQQSYVHKILSGQQDQFNSLRQFNGISGYQRRHENPYDLIEAQHPGSALSLASGYFASHRDNGHVIVVLGDQALSSGSNFEAFQEIAKKKQNIIILFNDTEDSKLSTAMLNQFIDRMRVTKAYVNTKREVSTILNDNAVGKPLYAGLKKVHTVLKDSMLHSSLFNELGFEYLGPINGHRYDELLPYLEKAKISKTPIVIHVKTKSGQSLNKQAFPFLKRLTEYPSTYQNYSEFTSAYLAKMASTNDKLTVVSQATAFFNDFKSFQEAYPSRFYPFSLDIQHSVMFSAGLALGSLRPYLELSSVMIQRVYDQINHDVCRLDLPVIIGVRDAGLMGEEGESFHGIFDYSLLKTIPNLIIAMGSDLNEHAQLLQTALKQYHPFALRYSSAFEEAPSHISDQTLAIGQWEIIFQPEGFKGIIIAYGPDVLKVKRRVEINQCAICVVNARYLKPIDSKMVVTLLKMNLPILIYETEMLTSNLGSSILEFMNANRLNGEIIRTGIDNHYVQHGSNNQLRKNEHIDLNTVLESFIKRIEEGPCDLTSE